MINVKSKNHNLPICIETKEATITEPKQISNTFNEYFTSVADDILTKRKFTGNKSYRDFLSNRLLENFVFDEITIEEVHSTMLDLNPSKANGPNSIPTKIMRLLGFNLASCLTKIFNISIQTGQHPKILRTAKAIPIHKKGSLLSVKNYRPISLLSNINKLLEKLVHARLYKFFEKNNILYNLQFGFRRKHSTNHALIEITERIRKCLDNGEYACGVFVDLQKAFDTVNHNILLNKLEHYGVRGVALNWFRSYLHDRKQFVSILGFDSDVKTIQHGVPQGSVLGPLLFLVYINDLCTAMRYCKIFHFADDTNLLNTNNSLLQIQKQVNRDLKILYDWMLANMISLNKDKTEMILFHKKGTPRPNMKIKLNGTIIHPSKQIKYVGIYIDEYLTFDYHCKLLRGRLGRAVGMLYKTRSMLDTSQLKTLYFAIFNSHLTYGCQIWAQTRNIHTEKIFTIQNKAMRAMNFSKPQMPSEPLYRKFNILKLNDYVKLQNCLFVKSVIMKTAPICFHNYFKITADHHAYNTRNSSYGCLYVTMSNTIKYGINSITFKCIYDWNFLTINSNVNLMLLPMRDFKGAITSYIFGLYKHE